MIDKLPGGTRGARTPPGIVVRLLMRPMMFVHRRKGDRFGGLELLYLTTVGAKTGKSRTNPVARFDDGQGGWLVAASAGGSAHHPGWYSNIAAHSDLVWAEVAGVKHHVDVEQLTNGEREAAWQRITSSAAAFATHETQTDRPIPVLRLTPIGKSSI